MFSFRGSVRFARKIVFHHGLLAPRFVFIRKIRNIYLIQTTKQCSFRGLKYPNILVVLLFHFFALFPKLGLSDSVDYKIEASRVVDVVGAAIAANRNIANGPIKGVVSFRFRASETSCVKDFHSWWRWTWPHNGYSAGDGGRYRISIQADKVGVPDGKAIGESAFYEPQLTQHPTGSINVLPFNGGCLIDRETYHIVIENIHTVPDANYVSFNGPFYISDVQRPATARPYQEFRSTQVLVGKFDTVSDWIDYPDRIPPRSVYINHWSIGYVNGRYDGEDAQYGTRHTKEIYAGDGQIVKAMYLFEQPLNSSRFCYFVKREYGSDDLRIEINSVSLSSSSESHSDRFTWVCHLTPKSEKNISSFEVLFYTTPNTKYVFGTVQRALWRPTRHFSSELVTSNTNGIAWVDSEHPGVTPSLFFITE